MKADLIRWAVLAMTITLLGGVQYSAWQKFIVQGDTTKVPIYDIDLRKISVIWDKAPDVVTPKDLVGPIDDAFNDDEDPEFPPEENGNGGGPERIIPGAPNVIAVMDPSKGDGSSLLILVEFNGSRDLFGTDEQLPNGWILKAVERIGDLQYLLKFLDEATNQTKEMEFEGEIR
ncbi:MAG: hypothetical protein O7H41_02435 [Planctomycetota bacterium]|nr:hypothetical protein [Planctomycetota bacterium]